MRSIAVPLIAALCAACGPRAVPQPPEPVPAPASAPVARPSPPPPAQRRDIIICVLHRGRLLEVRALYHLVGDTITMDSLPFSHVYPLTGEYASVAGWYVNREPIRFRGRPYTRYGYPRVVGVNELWRMGEYRGVGVYVEALELGSAPRVIYVPVNRGCEFQPYANVNSLATLPR